MPLEFCQPQKENMMCGFPDVTVFKEMFSEIQTCPSERRISLSPSQVISSGQFFRKEWCGHKSPGTVPQGANPREQGHSVQIGNTAQMLDQRSCGKWHFNKCFLRMEALLVQSLSFLSWEQRNVLARRKPPREYFPNMHVFCVSVSLHVVDHFRDSSGRRAPKHMILFDVSEQKSRYLFYI